MFEASLKNTKNILNNVQTAYQNYAINTFPES